MKTKLSVIVMALAIVSSQCSAIVVDGRADGRAEGYNFQAFIPSVAAAPANVFAEMYIGQQGSSLYLAFVIPLNYTDNTYGANTDPSWPQGKGHLFNDLIQSDQMVLMGDFNGQSIDTTIDYLEEKELGVGTDIYEAPIIENSGNEVAGFVVEAATSLEYNLEEILQLTEPLPVIEGKPNSSDQPDSPSDPASIGWIMRNVYEMRIELGSDELVIDEYEGFINGLSLYVGELHASPSKDASDWNNQPPNDGWVPLNPVPEPATAIIFAIGGLLIRRKN
ncbi:hypothetical protein SMSP2_02778 [Limihaloglobus sulfuriphilus]|uniref:PEP-CTERM protein-sorting domain-containing protein n=1 Tax=Limihaloglobus sulfuriphilus TaxID=1851148 RepID=A0A1Q2MIA6_9BACT|nr:PEP-CTERM sorting domain-containing protein [Limihaloglobus sulfuriphilus]AQQ72394.1 hypothetical protein SMSP2_02778 [Limihaloglobus sulfuriphilus]